MTVVKAVWDTGHGKRREVLLTELSADEFDAMKAAGNYHHVGMPIFWTQVITSRKPQPPDPPAPPQIHVWPMAPTATFEVDGVLADVPGDAVPPVSREEPDAG